MHNCLRFRTEQVKDFTFFLNFWDKELSLFIFKYRQKLLNWYRPDVIYQLKHCDNNKADEDISLNLNNINKTVHFHHLHLKINYMQW